MMKAKTGFKGAFTKQEDALNCDAAKKAASTYGLTVDVKQVFIKGQWKWCVFVKKDNDICR